MSLRVIHEYRIRARNTTGVGSDTKHESRPAKGLHDRMLGSPWLCNQEQSSVRTKSSPRSERAAWAKSTGRGTSSFNAKSPSRRSRLHSPRTATALLFSNEKPEHSRP